MEAKVLCFACLSPNRTLYSLGKYTNLFLAIFKDYTSFLSNITLCWECLAIIRKVHHFKEKVDHARTIRAFHSLNLTAPPSFSSLSITAQYNIDIILSKTEEGNVKTIDANSDKFPRVKIEINVEDKFLDSNNDSKLKLEDYVDECNDTVDTDDRGLEIFDDDDHLDDRGPETFDNEANDYITREDIEENIVLAEIKKDNAKKTSRKPKDKHLKSKDKPKKHDKKITKSKSAKNIDKKIKKESKKKSEKKIKTVIVDPKREQRKKYNNRYVDFFRGKVTTVKENIAKVQKQMERDRNTQVFKDLQNKCEKCVIGGMVVDDHMQKYHVTTAKRKFVCDICERTFPSKNGVTLHKSTRHTSIRQCLVCGYQCYCRLLMQHHLRTHRKHCTPLQCGICGAEFISKREYLRHQNAHGEFICDYCGLTFQAKDKIQEHITRNHSPLTCKQCNSTFSQYKYYTRHIQRYHVIQHTEDAFCVSCDKQFLNRVAYKCHLYNSMAHASERRTLGTREKVKCPECPNQYASKTSMRNHYNFVHKQEYKFRCPYCDKRLVSSSILKEHIRNVHMEIEPKKDKLCTICGRGFSTNRILTCHIRTHTGERPYHCTHCDSKFAQRSAMMSHIKRIHRNLSRFAVSDM